MTTADITKYVDVGVQTSPHLSATRTGDNSIVIKRKPESTTIRSRAKHVTYLEDSLQYDSPAARRVYPRTPVNMNRIKSYLPHCCPDQLPSPSLSNQAFMQRRVVSFPERQNVAHLAPRSYLACSRSVSMPITLQHLPPCEVDNSYDNLSINGSSSLSSDKEDYYQLNLLSQNGGPRTPSPIPSTHDSVEIIENGFRLSNSFLRHSRSQDIKGSVQKDWITWTNSPPRPIPALHGPASLPYARCPSGAEGTVIEEPSIVPGLIWGLADTVSKSLTCSPEMPALTPSSNTNNMDYTNKDPLQDNLCVIMSNRQEDDSDEYTHIPDSPQNIVNNFISKGAENETHCNQREEDVAIYNYDPNYSAVSITRENTGIRFPSTDRPKSILHAVLKGGFTSSSPKEYYTRLETNANSQEVICNLTHRGLQKKNLDPSAEVFIPNVHPGVYPHTQQVATTARKKDYIVKPMYERLPSGHDLPTPPDSTKSLWSNTLPSVFNEPHKNQPEAEQLRTCRSDKDLRLHIAELTGQLNQLIINQQRCSESNISHKLVVKSHLPPIQEESILEIKSTTQTQRCLVSKPDSRPFMPINLPMLVAHLTPEQKPDFDSPAVSNPRFIQNAANIPNRSSYKVFPQPVKATHHSYTCSDNYNHRPSHGDILTSKRNPRSVPFSRLFEKKLASVPEETDNKTRAKADRPNVPSVDKLETRFKTRKRQTKNLSGMKTEISNGNWASYGRVSSSNTNNKDLPLASNCTSKRKSRIRERT